MTALPRLASSSEPIIKTDSFPPSLSISASISVYRLNVRAVGAEVFVLGKFNNANSFKLCFIDQGETLYMVKEHIVSCYTLMKLRRHNFLASLTLTYALHLVYIANPNPNHSSYNIILNVTPYTASKPFKYYHSFAIACLKICFTWRTILQQISERFQFPVWAKEKACVYAFQQERTVAPVLNVLSCFFFFSDMKFIELLIFW